MRLLDKYSKNEKNLIRAGLVSLLILSCIIIYQSLYPVKKDSDKRLAEKYMIEMIDVVSRHCLEHGIDIDTLSDPKKTGLIGPEWTPITSTVGHLDAKRTTINPEFASLMLVLFQEAGVQEGDTIAIGSSGSFPGLLISSLAAAKVMHLKCKTIISIGSSSYGATRPELTILDIYQLLMRADLVSDPPLGVSLGGEGDLGLDWEKATIYQLREKIYKSNFFFIEEEFLSGSVKSRDSLYGFSKASDIKVFINAGGAMANIGTSETILGLKPGVVRKFRIPRNDKQGVIHKALQNEIPVIHLLNIKGLAQEYGLKWDPVIR